MILLCYYTIFQSEKNVSFICWVVGLCSSTGHGSLGRLDVGSLCLSHMVCWIIGKYRSTVGKFETELVQGKWVGNPWVFDEAESKRFSGSWIYGHHWES